jgi:hypothetical protein
LKNHFRLNKKNLGFLFFLKFLMFIQCRMLFRFFITISSLSDHLIVSLKKFRYHHRTEVGKKITYILNHPKSSTFGCFGRFPGVSGECQCFWKETSNRRTKRVERLNMERIDLMFVAMGQGHFSMKIPRAFEWFRSEGDQRNSSRRAPSNTG